MTVPETRAGRIEELLRERLSPAALEVVDESAAHAGHAGAASGGGHFRVRIVAEAFRGRSRIERHRAVHAALAAMLSHEIHALSIDAAAPGE